MRRILTTSTLLCSATLALLGTSQGSAQVVSSRGCAYEECSLRVKRGFFGSSLVSGSDEEKVAGLGFWIGNLDSVFEGSPVAQDLARTFRSRHNTGTVLALLGAAAVFADLASGDDWLYSDPSAAFWVGMIVSAVGGIVSQSSWDPLGRAVWEFNRAFSR